MPADAPESSDYARGYEQALVDAEEEALRLARRRMMPAVGLVTENLRAARTAVGMAEVTPDLRGEKDAATAHAERLEGLLRSVEWGGELPYDSVSSPTPRRFCLFCYGTTAEGHGPDCRYVAALAGGGEGD